MKLLLTIFQMCCMAVAIPLAAQQPVRLSSPNGNLVFSFNLVNKSAVYNVSFKSTPIIDNSQLRLDFENGVFAHNLKLGKPAIRAATETYELVTGKAKKVQAHFNEIILPLEETVSPFRKIDILVRAFDDGVAFRYTIPKQNNWSSYSLLDERTEFKIAGDPLVHTLFLENYTTSHEGVYSHLQLSDVKADTLMDMPVLFDFNGNAFMAITEAALVDYAGMYLSKTNGIINSRLSPLPKQNGIKVKAALPHQSPWRVLMISDRIGALIESNILTSLNAPCKIEDLSWIKPGKTTFPWWNGNVTPDTLNAPGNNFVTAQYYIDFCARNNIEYHSVVEYGLHQWYMDDGVNFQPGPHSDVTTPVPGLDMKEICDYARSKGVGVRVWVHWAALYPRLDTAFALFEKWGLKGMMVDFMDRDDQQMVNIQTEMLQKAAAHHLHIQFHGAYKPTGLNRTYPNEFTREGTRNYEVNKWDDKGLSPDNDIDIVFTRMLAGATDYHLGGFRAVPQSSFKTQYTRPLMLGTRCHMLAMYVVLENALQMVCDYPAAYEGQPGFEFIKMIPTTWDETKVIDAKAFEYLMIARRNNADWFAGVLTNKEARQLTMPLDFLDDGKYDALIYMDATDAVIHPDNLVKEIKEVTNKTVLSFQIAAGGGAVVALKRK